ncbi:translin [Archaeoglobus neptunius]|uniref:translin n=1 Tax=Archaeoglobus neptunius TaxID=2798580 RepID=UPI001926A56D|nr:translin [Archaeoglobus neptunius]
MEIEECRNKLISLERAREELLTLVRDLRTNSTKATALLHAGDIEGAEEKIQRALKVLEKVVRFRKFPEIYYSLTHDAMQELVEAFAFHKAVKGEFSFSIDLDIEPSAMVTGLADLIGELRRYALNRLVEGNFEDAERMMVLMEKIYDELVSFTFLPEKLVPGLRRKLDVARAGIERTKSDYIAAKVARLNEGLGRN